jgi:L-amino acid N-acyltransferase YncA
MTVKSEIRLIETKDSAEVLEIYKPYVLNTHITFEYDVPTAPEFLKKIEDISSEYPWLVYLENEKILGYAYGSIHRYRTAYKWSAESTIYLAEPVKGKGIGRLLYKTLFGILKMQGYFNVYAGVGLPNKPSERLHKSMGFNELGVFKNIGYKLGKWHDTKWFQLHLNEHIPDPPLPKKIAEIRDSPEFMNILQNANKKLKN